MVEQAPVISRPPAWAPDPWYPGYLRWWDGRGWTDQVRPLAPTPTHLDDPALRWVLPVGRSGWAIAAGYLGLFAVLLLPAPVALGVGWVALKDLRDHPDRLGRGRALVGVVMGALGTAGLLVLLVAGALAQ